MIGYTPEALRQIENLVAHYRVLDRPEAIRNLDAALLEAERRIIRNPLVGRQAPRPYPSLAERGHRWLKAKRYWVAYRASVPPIIVGVFFETANIPGRI